MPDHDAAAMKADHLHGLLQTGATTVKRYMHALHWCGPCLSSTYVALPATPGPARPRDVGSSGPPTPGASGAPAQLRPARGIALRWHAVRRRSLLSRSDSSQRPSDHAPCVQRQPAPCGANRLPCTRVATTAIRAAQQGGRCWGPAAPVHRALSAEHGPCCQQPINPSRSGPGRRSKCAAALSCSAA